MYFDFNEEITFASGNMSKILKVHLRTLINYEKAGILISERTESNRRFYTIHELKKAQLIQFLVKNLAINLAGVKIILGILTDKKISFEDSIDYMNNIAQRANISTETQKDNIKKSSRRGRKPKKVI